MEYLLLSNDNFRSLRKPASASSFLRMHDPLNSSICGFVSPSTFRSSLPSGVLSARDISRMEVCLESDSKSSWNTHRERRLFHRRTFLSFHEQHKNSKLTRATCTENLPLILAMLENRMLNIINSAVSRKRKSRGCVVTSFRSSATQ